MSRYLCCVPVCCLWRVLLATIFFLSTLGAARGAALVQDFYLPMPEAQISTMNNTVVSGTAGAVNSTFSILVTGDNTVIYYDQWEDGYETDLSNPAQPTTQIWGDGNDAHGIPPGFTHNPPGLPAGTVITLTNSVSLPRNPSQILWDARDHIAATKALVITRAGWPTTVGPVFAGAVGVLSVMDWGTNYICPVGQNLTNNLFKYVGVHVMAARNNTTVTIDPNGNGAGTTNIVLNQGESYLVNGGIKKGGRVTSTKPVQADLVIGHVGASYASDWFTLYPVEQWDNTYYTPVSSAAKVAQPTYVYLYNPNSNAIVVNYNTRSGSGSISVPGTNGVAQFQMPVGSGAGFASASGQNFYALSTVAANNTSDTSYNWGFTLVPKAALTTEADVGWGPGSADNTVDGSPVWITPVAATRIYVDYKGDHLGPLIDPKGNHYDTNFTLAALQSQKIYDPGKNQTGMRVYTLDGTLITGAWGEDADVAAPGNPYIDAGTTVLPFPVPTLIKTAVIVTDTPPIGLSIGDTIAYTVEIDNKGLLPLGNTVVIDGPSTNLLYVTNSTTWNGNSIADSATGTPFPLDAPGFTIPVILSRGTSTFTYLAQVTGAGAVSNSVNIGGTTIFSQAYLPPSVTNASVSLVFSDANGRPTLIYQAGTNVYVTMTNAVANALSNTVETVTVTVQDVTHGDVENIVLTETGVNTGVFRNLGGLPTSTTTGLAQQDGTLNVTPGDTLSVAYTDPIYGDSASSMALVQIPTLVKQLYLSGNGSTNGTQDLNRIDPAGFAHGPAYTSVDLVNGVSTPGNVALVTSNVITNLGSFTQYTVTNFNVSAAANRLLMASITFHPGSASDAVTNVTFGGQALSLVTSAINGTRARTEIWSLVGPASATTNLVVRFNGSESGITIGTMLYSGVNQTTPYTSTNSASNANATPTLIVASQPGDLVFNAVGARSSATMETNTPGEVKLWGITATDPAAGGCVSAGAASVTNAWTIANASPQWADVAVSIKAASTGGPAIGTNVTTFAQSRTFCSNFVMPSNNLVTITNYITVTNGILPLNPAVTAYLQTGGATFLSLTNPTYTSASNILVWSAVLYTNVTVPAGQAVSCIISNGQPNCAFHINYDSTNAPSKISLPTTTVITINSLVLYDAPYPGGNPVATPTAGSTVYVRVSVGDPFGSYDVSGLGINITGPDPSANLSTNLAAANLLPGDTCTQNYEFPWQTGSSLGNYNVVATAHEGTEGITAVASAGLTLIFLDLGTPSTTTFISSLNGSPTNSYPVTGSGSVCVQVQDLDQNTNPATAQTVKVTITSSAGDSETFPLAETSTNTGIFAGCIPVSTNGVVATNDGTLYAPAGAILTAAYTDATDPTDTSSATATIQPPPGVSAVKLAKTLVSPGGPAVIGQDLVFNLQVINTGSTVLTNVVVTDNFPSAKMGYSSASLTPTTVTGGSLTWANIGTMTPGQSTNITVTFTALAGGTATNSATANSGTVTNSSSATAFVTHAGLSITKLLLSPANSPVSINSNVVFRILVQNVGDTAIPTLPLEDNFSGAYFKFVSATIPPDGSGFGSLIWTNLAGVAALATNAIITNDITMTVVGQGNPANNTAVADYAVDIYGNSVPTASGSTNIVTAAATISGYVYNDPDQSGTLTAGDSPLSGVTIQIYTDPTGTGTPGTLVQVTTTDAGGYYELDNLTVGKYVVVATDLPGFANSAPVNGRLPLNITSLATSANNYFFQYQPVPNLYSTFSGTVFNDVAGTGSNTNQSGLGFVNLDLVQDVNSNGVADAGEPVLLSATTDTNGNYSFVGVTPGYYVLRATDPFGYYNSGDSQPPNDNQIALATTNGITSSTNYFFARLLPVAVNDTNAGVVLVPQIINPLANDISPNGDPLTISNAVATGGIVVINPGSTNLTFTPTSAGVATIIYTNADAHGGTSTAVITVNVSALADLAIGKSAATSVFAASNLVYTISVTNLGPSTASSVTVTDALPAGASFVSASGGGANNSGVVTWSLSDLASGSISNITLTVTAPAGGTLTNVATVGSPTGDPNPTNNATPPVITPVTPVADVAIGKSAAASVFAAGNLVYTISVTNFGPSTASSVTVTDALPAGANFVNASGNGSNNAGIVTWSLGGLPSGTVSNVSLTVTASAGGTLTNVATVGTPTSDPNPTNNTTPPVVTSVTPVADVAIGKSAPASVAAAGNLIYTIAVTNFGPSTASSVTVTDALPAGASFVTASGNGVNNSGAVIWSLGNLASGAVSNVTLTVAAPATGALTNIATVGTPTGDPNPTNNTTPPVVTTVAPFADVAIGKTAPASVLATSNMVYTISVTNFGPSTSGNVTVTDAVPVGATFVSAGNGGINSAGAVTWNLGDLASGVVSNLTLTVAAPANGTLTNIATAGSSTADSNSTNNTTPPVVTTVTPVADVAIGKTAAASVLAANNLVYTISVTNFGPSTASSVTVTDALPAGASFVSASGSGVNSAGVVTWSLGNLASGTVTNVTLTITAPATGVMTNLATVGTPTGDPNLTNNTTPPVTTAVTPVADLTIAKTGPAFVSAAGSINYVISVTNLGPSSAASVIVTDALPVGVTFVSASGGGSNNSGVVTWDVGALTAGQATNLTVTVTAPASGTLTNIAAVASPTLDTNTLNNTTPPVVTTVTSVADVAIGKTAVSSVLAVSNLVYTISVTNFGPSTATSVTVTDALPVGVSFVNASGNGVNTAGIVMWNLGDLANGAVSNVTLTVTAPASGALTNVATVGTPTGDPNPTNNTTPPVVTTVTSVADVAISKTAAASVLATSNLVYTISVTNFGPSTATSVTVTDAVPAGATFVSASGNGVNTAGIVTWNLGDLANGAASNVTLTVKAPASGTLSNIAIVGTPTGDPNLTNNTTPPVVTTVTPVADVTIGKTAASSVLATSNLVYTISVTNFGPSMASSVTVTDTLPAGTTFISANAAGVNNAGVVSWFLGNFANGAITNFTLTVAAPASGTLTNIATVGTLTGDPNLTNNTTPPVVTTVTPVADVTIGKTAAASILATSNLVYTISVTNFGPSLASSVTVTDALPLGTSFVSASGNGLNNAGVVTWNLGNLANGAASNVTLTVIVPSRGALTNIATVGTPTGDPNLTNNTTPPVFTAITPVADLAIGKSAAAGVLAAGNLVYTISVTNFGPSTASSVTVTDALPSGTTFVSAGAAGVNNAGVVSWFLGNFPNGAITNFTLTVKAPASGTLTNIATVNTPTVDPNVTNNVTPPVVTTIIPVADIAVGKSGPTGVTFNTTFDYTISVTNFGPSIASGVVVTDALPAGLAFVSAVPAIATNANGNLIWNLGSLPASGTTNLTLTVISTARGTVTNIASASTPTLDPSLSNNVSPQVVTLVTNIPPLASPDSYSITENNSINVFSPLLNDLARNPGGSLQLVSVSTTNGTAFISGPDVIFTADNNFVGTLTIDYTITDNMGGTNSSTITVLVTNIPPVANPDSYEVAENSGFTGFSPLANDVVMIPGGSLSLVNVSATNGTAFISGTNVVFAPAPNFFGTATIGYVITDGIGGTNSSVITVTVDNVPPVANAQLVSTRENTPVQITLTGSDRNHLPLTFAIGTAPANGTLSGLNPGTGTVTYTPNTNTVGADSFTFYVSNGQTNSAPATLNVDITPVADLAVVQSGPANGLAGSNLVFTVSVTNLGPATATSLVVSNQLAAGYTFVSASGNGINSGSLVTWTIDSLPANAETNLTVTAYATEGGTYTNTASGASAVLDLDPTNNNGALPNAQWITTITSVADLVIYKLGGTNVYAGAPVSYTIIASNAGPSTATSVAVQDNLPAGATFQSASGGYTRTNGVVTWSGITLAPGATTTFNVTLVASPAVGSFVNVASGTSSELDPNPANNDGSSTNSRVTTSVTPSADVITDVTGPANATLGSNIVYTITITNAGPSTASNVIVSDLLPPGLVFVFASSGGTNATGTVTWPLIPALGAGGSTNFTLTARSTALGLVTNVVSSTSTTFDPDPSNNTGVSPAARAQTQVVLPQFTILSGAPVLNPQPGLYEEQVVVTNSGSVTVGGIQLYVGGLRSGVSLYNAVGTNGGVPYVQYGYPVDPSNTVHFTLEFYNPSRLAFTNSLLAVAYMPTNAVTTGTNNSVVVKTIFADNRTNPPRVVLEWPSIPGKTYVVIYASTPNAANWFIATPSVTASANITQWYDDGPPKTASAPGSVNSRYYRVIQY